MKISRVQVETVLETYAKQEKQVSRKPAGEGRVHSDSIDISPDARLLVKVREALANYPEIREDLVADIKRRIAEGTYHVDSMDVAEKMVSRAVADAVAQRLKVEG